ncbi:NBS-LRR disease resistance protein [Corchorus olitorius]|uniref:NBS-LRR disease resistance protein n=1 Tax=Corchorus olitorius TaxID=93759 RepID=A0A1R3KSF5_9ROSI|nr:NBS-LRR disease resistance protein [Corchorus olitorius]
MRGRDFLMNTVQVKKRILSACLTKKMLKSQEKKTEPAGLAFLEEVRCFKNMSILKPCLDKGVFSYNFACQWASNYKELAFADLVTEYCI